MKNRLIGIIVLLLIVYIGSPIIFGTNDSVPVDITPQISDFQSKEEYTEPEKPQIDLFEEENIKASEQALRDNEKPEESIEKTAPTQYIAEKIKESPKATKRASTDKQGVPISWTLQLASFEDDKRAQSLLSKLHNKGFKAYSKHVDTTIGPRIRVYAGPSLDKKELLKTQTEIDKVFKLKSMLLRFTPDS